jgi:hypothetical protein
MLTVDGPIIFLLEGLMVRHSCTYTTIISSFSHMTVPCATLIYRSMDKQAMETTCGTMLLLVLCLGSC